MEKEHLKEIGQRLRQRRTELNLTREQFAELADIGAGYYGQIEVGTSQMSIDTLIKVSRTARRPSFPCRRASGRRGDKNSRTLRRLCTFHARIREVRSLFYARRLDIPFHTSRN